MKKEPFASYTNNFVFSCRMSQCSVHLFHLFVKLTAFPSKTVQIDGYRRSSFFIKGLFYVPLKSFLFTDPVKLRS